MKILAFSDLHRDQIAAQKIVEASNTADVIIGAGDFATRGEGALDTLKILEKCTAPVILVHGNHDNPTELANHCRELDNFYYLQGDSITLNYQTFFGLGGEIPSRNTESWNTSMTEENATELLKSCPMNAILITHIPPFGIADLQKNGDHEGSTAIHNAISNYEPKLLLCGHIHNAWGMKERVNNTFVQNLGPTVNWFKV